MRRTEEKIRGVFQHPPNSGVYWIQYFDSSGRRRREKVGRFRDATDLLAKRRTEKLQRIKLPERFREKSVTFGDLMDDALEHSKAENSAASSNELKLKYETLRPIFGNRAADEIRKQDIVRWLADTGEERDWKPATRNRWQAAFSLAFRVGMDNEKIERNPAARIRRKTEANGRVRFLSAAEEAKLRKALPAKYHPALDLSLHTGMRAGEQFSLRWNQVDFEHSVLTLPKTKNGRTRHIPLNAVAIAALQTLKRRNPRSPWVFLNRKQEKSRGHRDWFEPAVKAAGLDDYTWHCNRHTFASRLVMAGVDLRTVSDLLGHQSIQMTMRYAHLAPDHRQNAVNRLVAVAPSRSESATRTATRPIVPPPPSQGAPVSLIESAA